MHSTTRRPVTILTAAAAVLAMGAGIAVANHTAFTDVPGTNPFHDQIDSLADACVAGGFGDATFRPGDAVTRGQMTGFLDRGLARAFAGDAGDVVAPAFGTGAGLSTPVVAATVTVTTPDLPGDCDLDVVLSGHVTTYINGTLGTHCTSTPCQALVTLSGAGTSSLVRFVGDADGGDASVDAVVSQAPGTTETYELAVVGQNVDDARIGPRQLTAVVVPDLGRNPIDLGGPGGFVQP